MIPITVSIFLLTYNQESFIEQTLKSILSQETNFRYQLVIGEDCSIDKTRMICEKYANALPNKIKLLPALDKNIGLIANYVRTLKQCDGEFIAICDGDDYWTDSNKLQKQVDFLLVNTQCDMVYTNFTKLYPDNNRVNSALKNQKIISDFSDLVKNNFIPSVTAMIRNKGVLNDLPSWILKHPYGDWPTYLWILKDGGKIGFLDVDTSIYRMDIGISFKIIKKNSALVSVNLSILEDALSDKSFALQSSEIKKAIISRQNDLMVSFIREGSFLSSLYVLAKLVLRKDLFLYTIRLYFFAVLKRNK